MLLKDVLHAVPGVTYTLGAIALIVAVGVAVSLMRARRIEEVKAEGDERPEGGPTTAGDGSPQPGRMD